MIFCKVKQFESNPCNAVFFMNLFFAALQIFFKIFLVKCGVKWRILWKTSQNFEFSVLNLKWFFLFFLEIVIFTTSWNSTLKRTTLSNDVFHINVEIRKVDLTLFNVTSNIEIHNVVLTLVWHCPTSRRQINQKTTLKQRWNVCWENTS